MIAGMTHDATAAYDRKAHIHTAPELAELLLNAYVRGWEDATGERAHTSPEFSAAFRERFGFEPEFNEEGE